MILPKPTIPLPPKINPYDYANVRVYFDRNVFPVLVKTALGWYQLNETNAYCEALGLTPAMFIYNGTINMATAWSSNGTLDTIEVVNNQFDSSRFCDVDHAKADDPTAAWIKVREAVKGIATLAKAPSSFGATTTGTMPIILDIEGTQTYNQHPLTVPDASITATRWTNLIWAFRESMGDPQSILPLYAFGYWAWEVAKYWDGHEPSKPHLDIFREKERINTNILSGACLEFYCREAAKENPALWFAYVERASMILARYYPSWLHSKLATVSPVYEHNPTEPIPIALWKKQIEFLVARGWNLVLWGGSHAGLSAVKQHLDFIAKFNK